MNKQTRTRRSLSLALPCIFTVIGLTALLQAQVRIEPPAKPGVATTQPAATQPAVESKAGQARSTSRPADPEPRHEPTPSEILKNLIEKNSAAPKPVVRPMVPGQQQVTTINPSALPANAIGPVTPKLMPDGYRVVDRPGRLAREGDYWIFSFESRGRGETELPIRLLPNRLLEDMEMASSGGTKEIVFVISGEVTEYHGVNYLLIQKLLTRPDLGNLK
jgi:hypothetical protein